VSLFIDSTYFILATLNLYTLPSILISIILYYVGMNKVILEIVPKKKVILEIKKNGNLVEREERSTSFLHSSPQVF